MIAPGIIVLLLIAVAIGFLLGLLWISGDRVAPPPPAPLPPAPPPPTPYRYPDRLDAPALATEIGTRLAGTLADGSEPTGATPRQVVWIDGGDEVLVHLDSVRMRIVGQTLLVSVDLETDQTGRAPVIVAFALGGADDRGGLVATTDEVPYGHPQLARRWGAVLRQALWSSLLGLAEDHAVERALAASRLSIADGRIALEASEPLRVAPRQTVRG